MRTIYYGTDINVIECDSPEEASALRRAVERPVRDLERSKTLRRVDEPGRREAWVPNCQSTRNGIIDLEDCDCTHSTHLIVGVERYCVAPNHYVGEGMRPALLAHAEYLDDLARRESWDCAVGEATRTILDVWAADLDARHGIR